MTERIAMLDPMGLRGVLSDGLWRGSGPKERGVGPCLRGRAPDPPAAARRTRKLAMMLLAVVLATLVCVLLPLAHATPPDETWRPGIYDDADLDDVVVTVTGQVGLAALAGGALLVVLLRVAGLPSEDAGVVRASTRRVFSSRAPPASRPDVSLRRRSPAVVSEHAGLAIPAEGTRYLAGASPAPEPAFPGAAGDAGGAT
jgi:hypothetical protein